MQIIDDQERTFAVLSELGQHPVAGGCFVEVRCRCQLLPVSRCTGCLPDCGKNSKPELLRVLLVALHLDDCQPVALAGAVCPRTQQRGLSAACRGRDERYLCFRSAIKGRDESWTLNQSRSCRTRLSRISVSCHA